VVAINNLCQKDIFIPVGRAKRLYSYIFGDDLDFYEEFTIHLSDEEQERFFDANPDFMSKFSVGRDKMYLLRDRRFRRVLRKIKEYEDKHKRNV